MNLYEAVIFDLDGTLLDTLEDLKNSVNAALNAYHCPVRTTEEVRQFVGNGIRKLMERAVEGGESHPHFSEIFDKFKEDYAENCRNFTRPYDGITELLTQLKKDGIKLAIVSNKADFAVKELNQYYFKEFGMTAIGEKENIQRKPAPDMVDQALEELQVTAEHAVYVGDSDVDVQTAKNTGLRCISVLWGFRDREFLQKYGADCFAEKPSDILSYVKKD